MKNLKLITIALLCLFTCVINVSADETFSKAKVSVSGLTEDSLAGAYIKVSDVTLSDVSRYFAVFTKDTTVPDSFTSSSYPEFWDGLFDINGEISARYKYTEAAERFGDVYITFYYGNGGNYTKVSDPILIKRPEELKLSKRFTAALSSSKIGAMLEIKSIHNVNNVRTLNYKIGEVTDYAILKKIKNSDYSGLEELLAYAKKETNLIKSGSMKIIEDEINEMLYEQNQVAEGKYYYLYSEIDTEDGKYYPIEDVNLYQAIKTSDYIDFYSYTHSNFTWNIEEETTNKVEATVTTTTEEKKVTNPKTGTIATCIIAGLGVVSIVGTIIYIKSRKTSKFPQA